MYYRRRPSLDLLKSRRMVWLQVPGKGYVLITATNLLLTVYHSEDGRETRLHDWYWLADYPELQQAYDGRGWNLALLIALIERKEE